MLFRGQFAFKWLPNMVPRSLLQQLSSISPPFPSVIRDVTTPDYKTKLFFSPHIPRARAPNFGISCSRQAVLIWLSSSCSFHEWKSSRIWAHLKAVKLKSPRKLWSQNLTSFNCLARLQGQIRSPPQNYFLRTQAEIILSLALCLRKVKGQSFCPERLEQRPRGTLSK